jgi:hypothetical protein
MNKGLVESGCVGLLLHVASSPSFELTDLLEQWANHRVVS